MATVSFTANLARHFATTEYDVEGDSVAEVLDRVFALAPQARSYVLDDQGGVRRHVVIFVDGEQLHDRAALADAAQADSHIDVMQALSGG